MTKHWLAALFVCIFANANAQCGELFFSEYVEGYYNNKALEIYNPTQKTIDLTQYRLTTWHNGTSSFLGWYCDTLYGSIGPNSVKVLVINKRDIAATGLDTAVTPALKNKADLWISQNKYACMSLNFNGDDPVTLEKKVGSAWQMVDIFGKVGEQPQLASSPSTTIGWTDSFPFSTGKGTIYTRDHTLIRKHGVMSGVTSSPAHFNPSAEWKMYAVNKFDSLGTHRCDCNKFAAGIKSSKTESEFGVFPNPAQTNVTVRSGLKVEKFYAVSLSGVAIPLPVSHQTDSDYGINISFLKPGLYFLVTYTENGRSFTFRLQKE